MPFEYNDPSFDLVEPSPRPVSFNHFDALQQNSVDIISTVMGYDAYWTPQGTTVEQKGRVLFKDPTEMSELAGADFMPVDPFIEFRLGVFPGLFERVRDNHSNEEIEINGMVYYTRHAKASYDGKTFRVKMDLKGPAEQ